MDNTTNENINDVNNTVTQDTDMQEGFKEFADINEKAEAKASELAESMIKDIIVNGKKGEDNMTVALMTAAKLMTHLTSYFYDTPEEFTQAVDKARHSVTEDIIPALLKPTPCGECENCKNGNEEECLTPVVRADYTQSRFLPIVGNMLIEYDIFNKVIWMHTVGKQRAEVKTGEAIDKEVAENGNDSSTSTGNK